MAIVHFTWNKTEIPGTAQNIRAEVQHGYRRHRLDEETHKYVYDECEGPHVMWLWESHNGLCLFEEEENGYDDSDFFMTVWDPELQKPERICFASTRGWTYPALNSYVDATPEVRSAYKICLEKAARRDAILKKWETRISDSKLAETLELGSRKNAKKFREAFGGYRVVWDKNGKLIFHWSRYFDSQRQSVFISACKLLNTKKFKSAFRESLANQIRTWVMDPAPKYDRPLSPKQMEYI